MSERDHYPPGVPCWVETLQADPKCAMDFYASLFGWEYAGPAPIASETPGKYYVGRVGGRDVAGIGSVPDQGAPQPPAWTTYVCVQSVSETAAKAAQAGGTVLVDPLDAPPAGSLAVLADPAGAVFGVWQPQERYGAQRINEASAWALSSLRTNDPGGTKAFYGMLFGWQTEPFGDSGAGMELFRLPGYMGGEPLQPVPRDTIGVVVPMGDDAPDGSDGSNDARRPRWDVDFWIDGVDAGAERAASAGGAVIVPPFEVGQFRSAVLADAAGAVFSISQLMIEP